MRQPDAHLNPGEIDVLLRSSFSAQDDTGQGEGDAAEARLHLAACDICRRRMDMHAEAENRLAQLRTIAQVDRAPECPPEAQWPLLSGGLLQATEEQELIGHAAACDHCGQMLRENIAYFADQLTPDEEILLGSLESSQASWQRQLASEICDSQPRRSLLGWVRQHVWPSSRIAAWAYGGAVAALAGATVFGIRLLQQPPVETLLATAYTEQRPLDLRIPGAAHAPVRLTRGSVNSSRLDRPTSLLNAELRIAKELQQHPSSPALFQAKGRAELLERDYQNAIQDFERARESGLETPALLTDLASAYFESAEANQRRQSDYSTSLQLLDKALKSAPDDPIALFNRAIVSERMGLRERAIEDWRHYLRVDSGSGWASEARQRLTDVEQQNTTH